VFLKSFVMSFGGRSRSCRSSSCLTMLDLFMFSFSSFHVFFAGQRITANHCQSLLDLWGILVAPGGVWWISWASEPLSTCTSGCGVVPCRLQVWSPGFRHECKMRYSTCPKVIQETKRKI
jgi:hypothetical protein